MFGYTLDELVGQNVTLLIPPRHASEPATHLQDYLETGQWHLIGAGREVPARRKDGSVFPADLVVSEVEHLRLYTGILRDISQRKELQRHVLEIADAEQRRLGQELHDGIGQELTSLALMSATLLDYLGGAGRMRTAETPLGPGMMGICGCGRSPCGWPKG